MLAKAEADWRIDGCKCWNSRDIERWPDEKIPIEARASADCGRDAEAGSVGVTCREGTRWECNQVFQWRKQYREGRLEIEQSSGIV